MFVVGLPYFGIDFFPSETLHHLGMHLFMDYNVHGQQQQHNRQHMMSFGQFLREKLSEGVDGKLVCGTTLSRTWTTRRHFEERQAHHR